MKLDKLTLVFVIGLIFALSIIPLVLFVHWAYAIWAELVALYCAYSCMTVNEWHDKS